MQKSGILHNYDWAIIKEIKSRFLKLSMRGLKTYPRKIH